MELFEVSEAIGTMRRVVQDLEAKVDRLELSIAENSAYIKELEERV
jgi:hypothetical protein